MVGSMSGLLPGVLGLLSHPDPDYSVVRTLKARRTPALLLGPTVNPTW
jgi:hypothetical protein